MSAVNLRLRVRMTLHLTDQIIEHILCSEAYSHYIVINIIIIIIILSEGAETRLSSPSPASVIDLLATSLCHSFFSYSCLAYISEFLTICMSLHDRTSHIILII